MRNSLSIVTFGLVVVGCGGCILPVPHTRVHAYGVTGQVVDAAERSPVPGASIASIDELKQTANTDSTGRFRLRARRGWHGADFIGPLCLSALPGWDVTAPRRDIRISAPGYKTEVFAIRDYPDGTGNVVVGEVLGAYLRVGRVKLAPMPRGFPVCELHTATRTQPIRSATNQTSSAAAPITDPVHEPRSSGRESAPSEFRRDQSRLTSAATMRDLRARYLNCGDFP